MDEEQFKEVEREKADPEEHMVDLNQIFKDEPRDLNSMFPDGEMRKFLRQVNKNRRSNERFLEGIDRTRLWEEDE